MRTQDARKELDRIELGMRIIEPGLKFDVYDLQSGVQEHCEFYYQAAILNAEAVGVGEQVKLRYKEARAERELYVRSHPSEFESYGKLTEGTIASILEADTYLVEVDHLRVEAMRVANLTRALADGFEHRRSMINNEVNLIQTGMAPSVKEAKHRGFERQLEAIRGEKETQTGAEKAVARPALPVASRK